MSEVEKPEVKNAKIIDTFLGFEDHGIFTAFITLEYGDGNTQGFGGYTMDAKGMTINPIGSILRTVGVEKWEELKGKNIRAVIENNLVVGIGHFMKGFWCFPKSDWYNDSL